MTTKIVKLARSTTKKDGTVLKDKWGNDQERVAIQTSEHGGRWLTSFFKLGKFTAQVGDEIEIDVKESANKDTSGVPYLNFYLPRKEASDEVMKELNEIQLRLAKLEGRVDALSSQKTELEDIAESIPF